MRMEPEKVGDHCRFVTSLGGVVSCLDMPYREGFCRFHFDAFLRGEVLPNGQISERLTNQHRRRALNYHGIPPDAAS
jgi:hypothetical protein